MRCARYILLGLLALTFPAHAGQRLTLLIWEDYIAPELIEEFAGARQVTVNQITFDEEADIIPLLAEHRSEVDLVVANTSTMNRLKRERSLLALDKTRIPNAGRIHNRWQSDSSFVVPYMWGTTGVAWRKDKVPGGLTSWADLFALAEKQPGQVGLLTDPGEHLLAAHFALGNKGDFTSVAEVEAAARLLRSKRNLFRFVESDVSAEAGLVTGELIATQAWNGDVAFLRDSYDAPLAYAIPQLGCMIWQDSFAISASAPNPDLAHAFLDFINKSRNAARNAEYIGFASSNPMALLNAGRDYLNDPIIHPAFEGLDHCSFYRPYEDDIQAAIEQNNLSR